MTRARLATAEHLPACLHAVEKILRDREAGYPPLVEAGRMTAAQAAQGLERARVLLAQWRWVIDGPVEVPWDDARGVSGFGAYDFELAADLAGAVTRARAQGSQVADLAEALHWWQQSDHGLSGVARIVSYTVTMRRVPSSPAITRAA